MSDSLTHGLSGSSVHGILQARRLEWVTISFSRGSSQLRDQTHVFCFGRRILLPLHHLGSPWSMGVIIITTHRIVQRNKEWPGQGVENHAFHWTHSQYKMGRGRYFLNGHPTSQGVSSLKACLGQWPPWGCLVLCIANPVLTQEGRVSPSGTAHWGGLLCRYVGAPLVLVEDGDIRGDEYVWCGTCVCWVTQSCPTLCDTVDCSLSSSSVQARIVEWVTISFSRGSSGPRDRNRVSYISCTGRRFFTTSATWEGWL